MLRLREGWAWPVELNGASSGQILLESNRYGLVWKYTNPNDSSEYFLIEAIRKSGRYADGYGEGLLIWHVDENMPDNRFNDMTPAQHRLVSPEQADGNFDLELGVNYGDAMDYFGPGTQDQFTDGTTPSASWWSGSSSSLSLTDISPPSDWMSLELTH